MGVCVRVLEMGERNVKTFPTCDYYTTLRILVGVR